MTLARRRLMRIAGMFVLGAALSASASAQEIVVLSNRADLVSGGDALVEIKLPPAAATSGGVTVDIDGRDVTRAFSRRADGRYYGLIGDLKNGDNVLTATMAGRRVRITLTNHPIGGPVFSGPQVQPWVCQTPNFGLPEAVDAQCDAPSVVRWVYRTLSGEFVAYDPANPPVASAIAMTTTDAGVQAPFIVGIERGTIDRGIHDIAVLANPAKLWAPWAPQDQPAWNHKLYIPFGSGCEFGHLQGGPGNVMNANALGLGFMVTSSSNTQYGTHCNDVVSAETVMMLKEHIIKTYGPIRYTQATGGSGGAHQQNLIASNYPGLLQGIIPSQHFQDTWTPYREFADCGLLAKFYAQKAASGPAWTEAQKATSDGHANASTCEGPISTFMASRTATYLGPAVSQGCGGNPWTWSLTNLAGVRCTLQDYQIAVFGRRATDATDPVGYAKRPYDNVGLQYGLVALNAGVITPAMFTELNASIGCYDINQVWQPQRCVADPGAVKIAYSSGRITNGRQMAKVAMIDLRDNNDREEHYNFRTYVTRARLINANGKADNQAIWRTAVQPAGGRGAGDAAGGGRGAGAALGAGGNNTGQLAFTTMNEWLAAIEADRSAESLEQKVVDNRPTLAVDTCFQDGKPVAASVCDAIYRTFTDTRVAAGEPTASDIMKCRLKSLNRADYKVAFTDTQWTALQRAFPTGVCDFSKPGVDQVTPEPWQSFAEGPGGRPLGQAPVSQVVR
jgi:hypothetical protein